MINTDKYFAYSFRLIILTNDIILIKNVFQILTFYGLVFVELN